MLILFSFPKIGIKVPLKRRLEFITSLLLLVSMCYYTVEQYRVCMERL